MALDLQWENYTISRHYKAGEYVFREGDPSNHVYYVRSGLLAINKDMAEGKSFMLNYRGPGNLLGEISILKDLPRTASVVAAEDSELLEIDRQDFLRLMGEEEDFRQMVMETLIGRILSADTNRIRSATWERELIERFASLSSEHDQIAEVMRLRHDTMSFIIHDLRSPIGLATTALEMIKMMEDYDEASQTARFILMAQNGMNRLLNLVDSLLDVERLEAGEAKLRIEEVNPVDLMDAILDHYRPMAGAILVSINYDVIGDIPIVEMDSIRVERVIANLLDNALKFTMADGSIKVQLVLKDGCIQISVNDGGPGIPEESRVHVFDRFSQAGEAGHQAKGFGLGLAFCRTAIMAHGGEIWIEDGEDDVGSKFIFTIPLRQN